MNFEIRPHVGTNNIKFGMTRGEVQEILGSPESSKEKSIFKFQNIVIPEPAKDGYFKNSLQISYDDNEQVEYIEFSGRGDEYIEVFLNDIEIFKTPAKELLNQILEITECDYDKQDIEVPYSFVYRNIDLSLWRQVIPDVNENTEEVPESDEGKYFWTVGIGIKGYHKKE
jgi:hypothetical protein